MKTKAINDKIRVRRAHKRAHYDRKSLNTILDAGISANIAYIHKAEPMAIPMVYWRRGDYVYWHGSTASRTMRFANRQPVCFSVTLLDGLVLAQSAFHHSANYRSVILFGVPEPVTGDMQKTEEFQFFIEKLTPGRWKHLRPMTAQELKATSILRLKIDQGVAKIRTGMPIEDKADIPYEGWSGILDINHHLQTPQSAPDNPAGLAVPDHIKQLVGKPFS